MEVLSGVHKLVMVMVPAEAETEGVILGEVALVAPASVHPLALEHSTFQQQPVMGSWAALYMFLWSCMLYLHKCVRVSVIVGCTVTEEQKRRLEHT